jgi:conjugal transfer pilus assembly protein TraK
MRRNSAPLLLLALLASAPALAAQPPVSGTLAATVIPMSNGGQASIALSNTDPNLLTVPGDRITAITSLDGILIRQMKTASGGVVISTVSKTPLTFIIETERGMNFSVRAVPRRGVGRTFQLVTDLGGTGETPRRWEEAAPYEETLVNLNRAVRGGSLPEGYSALPVTTEQMLAPAGLQAQAVAVWAGHHLKVVCYRVTNRLASPVFVSESAFWQPGVRAVMFPGPAAQILPGAARDVYVTVAAGEEN